MIVHCCDCDCEARIHAYLLAVCCDLPARAAVLNAVQFNGYYGCCYCEQPGVTCPTERGGHVHTFPFVTGDPKGPARTTASISALARQAQQQGTAVSIT